ncbi:beta-galactosidase [Actinoallomurus sp. NPDC052274]|uniref:beta-galactosidase n=1 Tax=Actinoallomurus sp. NPDC052274 TaxID=3155420 RepID=UPI00342266A4
MNVRPVRRLKVRLLALLAAVTATLALAVSPLSPPTTAVAAAAPRHRVTYDHYSVSIDGQRVLLRSAEFHYFRLPSPDLWRDVLEKYRSAGFNTVSIYFDWAYHSPKAGEYDFTGVRDVDRLLTIAQQAGLYVIARPGPYINAETTGGGFPAWLKNVPGRARTSAPGYTAAYRDWLGHIDPILARHQITRGGSVILYNVENEYAEATDAAYMEDIQNKARADGIDVPTMTNDCCDAASWTSTWASGQGAVQIPGVDDYPQGFDCANADTSWGPWGAGLTERLREDAPVFAAEYQGGSIDQQNAGFDKCRELTGPKYMKFFYKSNLIESGATAFNYYMGFGGTNWGWLAQPNDVYTSYDYGSAITENRLLSDKYDEFKRQNLFLASVAPLTRTDPATAPASSNQAIETVARVNTGTRTQFVLVRHSDHAATTDDSATLDWTTPDGRYQVPVRVEGRDAKVLIAGYDLGGQRLVWSNSELMTHTVSAGRDIAVLYGTDGTQGSTVLRYSSRPTVKVLQGSVKASYSPRPIDPGLPPGSSSGDLRLDYTHSGLARVLISGGGRRPLLLLLGTDAEAAKFWQAGPLLVRGTSLVRSATVRGQTAYVRADTAKAEDVEVFGDAHRLVVNGSPVRTRPTASGSLLGTLPGPEAVRLPALTGWRSKAESPETRPAFDDSGWTAATKTTTESPLKPKTPTVLYADDYGYHYGDVWYRGRFTGTGAETKVSLNAFTGKRGSYLVWLNGRYLGSAAGGVEADADAPVNPAPGRGDFTIPAGLVKAGQQAVLSVLVENQGHNDDWIADDNRFKQPRGLYAVTVTGSDAPISWRIQGAKGGENLTDPTRGPLNNGGLYGERAGWHLPAYPDGTWKTGAATKVTPGVTWQRTSFRLDLPKGQDVPIALRFGGPVGQGYRVQIFLNGWNLGQYGGDIGPQTDFTLPAGLLRQHGGNTLALAIVARADATPAPVSLVALGNERGGVPVSDVPSPSFR